MKSALLLSLMLLATHGLLAQDLKCPDDIDCAFDLETGLQKARETGKPILLNFTGWACVNCRKMEDEVWSDPRIRKALSEQFVLVSLYADDKTLLPEDEWHTSKILGNNRMVKRVGTKWAELQVVQFKSGNQPHYTVLDHNGEPVNQSMSYHPVSTVFYDWLISGHQAFLQSGK